MTRARPAPRTSLTATVLVLGGLLVGCGGSDDAAPADPSPSESTSTSASSSSAPTDPAEPSAPAEPTEPASPTQDTVPTSYDVAAALVDGAPGPARRANRFQTVGGAVFCILDSDFLPTSCELAQGASVPAPDVCGTDGPSDAVGRIELTDGVATPVCNSDTIREGNARDLAVGETTSIKDLPLRCLVQAAGVTCVDDDARSGFFVGDGAYEVF